MTAARCGTHTTSASPCDHPLPATESPSLLSLLAARIRTLPELRGPRAATLDDKAANQANARHTCSLPGAVVQKPQSLSPRPRNRNHLPGSPVVASCASYLQLAPSSTGIPPELPGPLSGAGRVHCSRPMTCIVCVTRNRIDAPAATASPNPPSLFRLSVLLSLSEQGARDVFSGHENAQETHPTHPRRQRARRVAASTPPRAWLHKIPCRVTQRYGATRDRCDHPVAILEKSLSFPPLSRSAAQRRRSFDLSGRAP